MQVASVKPMLKLPGTKRLKIKYGVPPSSFAFEISSRRYTKVLSAAAANAGDWVVGGGGGGAAVFITFDPYSAAPGAVGTDG